jgi:phage gp16-like protein
MTKKDFELIANTLRTQRLTALYDNWEALDALARDFADALKATNKQFNRVKFLRACGVHTNG